MHYKVNLYGVGTKLWCIRLVDMAPSLKTCVGHSYNNTTYAVNEYFHLQCQTDKKAGRINDKLALCS